MEFFMKIRVITFFLGTFMFCSLCFGAAGDLDIKLFNNSGWKFANWSCNTNCNSFSYSENSMHIAYSNVGEDQTLKFDMKCKNKTYTFNIIYNYNNKETPYYCSFDYKASENEPAQSYFCDPFDKQAEFTDIKSMEWIKGNSSYKLNIDMKECKKS